MRLSLLSFAKLAVALSIAGAAAGLLTAVLIPDKYISEAALKLTDKGGAPLSYDRAAAAVKSLRDLAQIGKLPHRVRIDLVRPGRHVPPGAVFMMRVYDSDPAKARSAAQLLVTRFEEANLRLALESAPLNLEVVDPADTPGNPAWPNRPMIVIDGLVAGLFIAIVIGLVRRKSRPTAPLEFQSA